MGPAADVPVIHALKQQAISANSRVSLHFEIRLEDGSIAESTYETEPLIFKMGRDVFSPAFEQSLLGLQPGHRKDILLQPEDAFGERHPAKIYQMPLSRFREPESLEEGVIFAFSQPSGATMPGVIRAVGATEVTVDFNHPLAGLVVLMKVEVMDVTAVSAV